jgi:hypothetical protein
VLSVEPELQDALVQQLRAALQKVVCSLVQAPAELLLPRAVQPELRAESVLARPLERRVSQ